MPPSKRKPAPADSEHAEAQPEVFRRVFRAPPGYVYADHSSDLGPAVATEALHRGLRPTGEPRCESTVTDDDTGQVVITWAVPVVDNTDPAADERDRA